jgi:anti-anti-sigma factor
MDLSNPLLPEHPDPDDPTFRASVTAVGTQFVHVAFAGELDVAAEARAEAALRSAESQTDGTVVVDLSGLRFVDSCGVHLLSAAARRLRGRLIVLRGPAHVQRVFELTEAAYVAVPFAD